MSQQLLNKNILEIKMDNTFNNVIDKLETTIETFNEFTETVREYKSVGDLVQKASTKGINKNSAKILNHSLESIDKRLESFGIDIKTKVPSLESFGTFGARVATQVAIEGIGDKLESLWNHIKKMAKRLWEFIKGIFVKIKRLFFGQKDKIIKLDAKLEDKFSEAKAYYEKLNKKISPASLVNKETFKDISAIDSLVDTSGKTSEFILNHYIKNFSFIEESAIGNMKALSTMLKKASTKGKLEGYSVNVSDKAFNFNKGMSDTLGRTYTGISNEFGFGFTEAAKASVPVIEQREVTLPSEVPSLNFKEAKSVLNSLKVNIFDKNNDGEAIFKEINEASAFINNNFDKFKYRFVTDESAELLNKLLAGLNRLSTGIIKLRSTRINDVLKYIAFSINIDLKD